ncbi:UNVERIFIED_CONTAM: Retrovirus-related Pol polyprotein from transposon TNT 1-94 [Sesamum latifolium]|uniref:Retrovirus-related Pol polyprotein from transposon TNT 1-94 n=1 Tax=Sesamum latifolium TaxID=2727402 RepID=A0AAW2STG3_9LAMI
MIRLRDLYAVPDRHIRYAMTKAFFGTKMAEESSVHDQCVQMLSFVENLEDLKAGIKNDTYIDVFLQSLPPTYDPFIENFNMNGLEKSIPELINMLVQFEVTIQKLEPVVMLGEASTSKKGKKARCWKKKECQRGIRRGTVLNFLPLAKVTTRSTRLSKGEVDLRLGNGKRVAAEAVGLVHLFEAFEKFKEFQLEVENQTGRKIKILRSDRGGEYLIESLNYLKENGILSQWTPPRTPQLNAISERRNRTLLDMVRSMMSFTELPISFWGYALETVSKLLNMMPSKIAAKTPYEIWHGKLASYKYLRV